MDACAWIHVDSCPYSADTYTGCPYLAQVDAGTVEIPAHCVAEKALHGSAEPDKPKKGKK